MKTFKLLTLAALLVSGLAHSANRPFYQDVKLPTQKMLEYQVVTTPVVASATRIVSATAGATSTAQATLSTFTLQPDVPRNITITPAGTTGDVEACVVVVNGTNFHGRAISENFTFVADQSTIVTGNKAFKTVTSVVFPANCESGGFAATWNIGVGSKLGLKRCVAQAGDYAWSVFNGAYETTRGTMAVNASAVESNTFIPNGTMDGLKDVGVYFVQNFAAACQP